MSPEADVLEMKSTFERLAELLLPRGTDQAQATAIQSAFPRRQNGSPLFTWNRAYELLKGKAKRVDGFEKDNAKRRLAELLQEEEAYQRDFADLQNRVARLEAALSTVDEAFFVPQMVAHRQALHGGRRGHEASPAEREGGE